MEQNVNFNQPQISLPNATAVLILGILSIPACCCCGIGFIPAVIALFLSRSDSKQYFSEPEKYLESSYKNLNAGKICAWIGLAISLLYIVLLILIMIGFMTQPALLEQFQDAMKQYQ